MTLDLAQAAADAAAHVSENPLGAGAVLAVLTTEAIEWAKRSHWKVFSAVRVDTPTANRVVGGLVAFIAGLGITWSYDPTTGQLIVNNLLAGSIMHAFAQWAQQQIYYRLIVQRTATRAEGSPAA